MKIKFFATGNAPDGYSFSDETVTANVGGVADNFDLSAIEHGDKFLVVDSDVLPLFATQIIRNAERDESGLLWVTLCQQSGSGAWKESEWIDSSDYVEGETYIVQVGDPVG